MGKCAKDGTSSRLPRGNGLPSRRFLRRQALPISILWLSWFIAHPVQSAAPELSDTAGSLGGWKNLGSGIIRDERTKLEWSQDDNGDDIDWNKAKSNCEGRHDHWRLPSLQELKSIYDEHARGVRCAQTICKVSSQFHLTGSWFWSATQVGKDSTDGIELAWGVLMANGAQTQTVRDASYGSRVLCVRGP
jgi:Protein of unknown function (DUF1566)